MKQLYYFGNGTNVELLPMLAEVGGKGLSLLHMTSQGFPVPGGLILPSGFFRKWIDEVKNRPEWKEVLSGNLSACIILKNKCMELEFDQVQSALLDEAMGHVSGNLFAVRSSSPEEDLEGASFAGGYETTLGVTRDKLQDAIRSSFASCLDARVFAYKRERGFDLENPRIAVVVQKQIVSETAGVAFSLNPLNNCYDEAVINANFGLGESVVSGLVSPDLFVVDKIKHDILEKKPGKKQSAIFLLPEGGTYEKQNGRNTDFCIDDRQALGICAMLEKIESYYGHPVDIEWAYAENSLYLLQARPITAYVPLPNHMLTKPGMAKRVYLDITLVKQGINEPISVMGCDFLAQFEKFFYTRMAGKDVTGLIDGLGHAENGRMYLNLGNNLKVYGKQFVEQMTLVDMATAQTMELLLNSEYIPQKTPKRLKGTVLGMALRSMGIIIATSRAKKSPENYEQELLNSVGQYQKEIEALAGKDLTLMESCHAILEKLSVITLAFSSLVSACQGAKKEIENIFKNESPAIRKKAAGLDRALPNNVTTDMGHRLYRLSRFVKDGQLTGNYHAQMEEYLKLYGFRCVKEIDISTPRPIENPSLLIWQLTAMAENSDVDPAQSFERMSGQREADYAVLLTRAKELGKEKKLAHAYHVIVTLMGYRESIKYYMVNGICQLRGLVLQKAASLVEAGRLQDINQIFDLKLEEVDQAIVSPGLQLLPLIEKNTVFIKKLKTVRSFPKIIDSRGKIHKPPVNTELDGVIHGDAISPGIVRGRVKVLHAPDEKPLLPGEILVTRATDPGWTPLFINACGIVLEAGGVLQHGALVAREYGKPCVSGIDEVSSRFHDGQWIELDGDNGTVRIIEEAVL